MALTSPSTKIENMAISEEICNYFSDLIKLFALTQSLEEIFFKLKELMVSKLEEKLEQQMNPIDKLEDKLERQRANYFAGKHVRSVGNQM